MLISNYLLFRFSVPFDDKVKLSDRIKKLPPPALGELIELIKVISAKSIKIATDKKLQIVLTEIDKELFKRISEFIDKKVAGEIQEPAKKRLKVEE